VDGIVLSLSAKGLTTGEISAHLAEVYGASVSKDTISAITDRVLDAMAEWQSRPLDPAYPVVFVDAIRIKIRDGNVVNRLIYLALGVTVDGERDILGLWGRRAWRRRRSQILASGAHRAEEPRRARRARLRRVERSARLGQHRVGPHHRANMRDPLVAQQLPVRVQAGTGQSWKDLRPI
jgi:hypothetical protein